MKPVPPITPECELIAACFEHARAVGGAALTFISLKYADGRRVRFGNPHGFLPPEVAGDSHRTPQPASSILLARFLSRDSRTLLRAIAERGPIAGKVLAESMEIERSRAYVLLSDLKERQLVRDGPEGYEMNDIELWERLKAA